MAEEATVSASEQKKEDWMNAKWRPMMGWMYMLVCTMDMVVFPILWSLLQTLTHTQITQWNPLTLQGAGLFHIAMGAVLGIAAFGRTQEKLGGANNGGLQPTSQSVTTTFGASQTNSAPAAGFGGSSTAPSTSGFGSSSGFGATAATGFGSSAPASGVTAGFGGKAAPPPQAFPAI